jgi:hypothetical protein
MPRKLTDFQREQNEIELLDDEVDRIWRTKPWACTCGYENNEAGVNAHYTSKHTEETDKQKRVAESVRGRWFGRRTQIGPHHELRSFACTRCKKIIGCDACDQERSEHTKKEHSDVLEKSWFCKGWNPKRGGHPTRKPVSINGIICVSCLEEVSKRFSRQEITSESQVF